MSANYQKLYSQIGHLLETAPEDLQAYDSAASMTSLQWLGRLHAQISEAGMVADAALLTLETGRVGSIRWDSSQVFAIAYRALAFCETRAPTGIAGAFVPVGNAFDAYSHLSKILGQATSDVFVVDPYSDATVLTDFGTAVPVGVRLRLLADFRDCKPDVKPATEKWQLQYAGTRPLEVRLASHRSLHDRAIITDSANTWTITQSFKDFAKRSPGEIVRSAIDVAQMKIDAYEAIWKNSTPI